MRTAIAAGLGVLALVLSSSPATADPLWDSAVKHASDGLTWRPAEVAVVARAFTQGNETGREEMWYVVKDQQTPAAVMTKHLVNGQTSDEGVGQTVPLGNLYPATQPLFDPANQSSIRVEREGEDEIDGVKTVVFRFWMDALEGRAWLEAAKGYPLRARYVAGRLPAGTTSALTELTFAVDSAYAAHTQAIVTTVEITPQDPAAASKFVTSFSFAP